VNTLTTNFEHYQQVLKRALFCDFFKSAVCDFFKIKPGLQNQRCFQYFWKSVVCEKFLKKPGFRILFLKKCSWRNVFGKAWFAIFLEKSYFAKVYKNLLKIAAGEKF
jgi:hypothetical protein